MKKILFAFLLPVIFTCSLAYGDEIFITSSDLPKNLILDGKWSTGIEWKPSSENIIHFDNQNFSIRSAHDRENLYFLIDFITDTKLDAHADRATICIDGNNDKTNMAGLDDYCFMISLEGKNPIILQGGTQLKLTSNFESILPIDGFIAKSTSSGKHNRYSTIPHTSYEFKIPIEIVGRSDVYGFYVGVFESHSGQTYSWPQNINLQRPFEIPSPSLWGELISPDKTIPEFGLPIIALFVAIFSIIFITNSSKLSLTKSKF